MKKFPTAVLAGAMLLAAVGLVAVPVLARATNGNYVTVKSSHNYSETVTSLERSVKSNGLMVMGTVDQRGILSMTGLNLEGAKSFLVGNPRVGKKLFEKTPAVAAVVPARISVWTSNGTTYLGYFAPSALLKAISPGLAKPGRTLDMKFRKIVQEAAH